MKMELKAQRNILLGLVVLLVALTGYLAFYVQGDTKKVASINGTKIIKSELYDLMVKQSGPQALDTLISQKIVDLEAKKANISVTDNDIQTELEKYYDYYGGQEAFIQTLTSSGYTLEDVKKDMAVTVKIRKLLEPRISVTDEEMKAYFEENKESLAQGKQVRASHILVDSLDKANQLKKQLNGGADFAALAKENSNDTSTSQNGGELGFFGSGQMVKEFEDAAFALKTGQISEPVKTDYGYHIIKVEEIKEAQPANYEESKEKIRAAVLDEKLGTEYDTWLQEMYQQYKIEKYLEK